MTSEASQQWDSKWSSRGIFEIDSKVALDILQKTMNQKNLILSVVDADWARLQNTYIKQFRHDHIPILFSELTEKAIGKADSDDTLLLRLGKAAPAARYKMILSFIHQEVAELLGFETDRLDPKKPFLELGLDSLMGTQLAKSLEKNLQRTIPSTIVYNFTSIVALTNHVFNDLLEPFSKSPVSTESNILADSDPLEEENSELDELEKLSVSELNEILEGELNAIDPSPK